MRTEEEKKELQERIGEVEIERQMEKELLDDDREEVERKVVRDAIGEQSPRQEGSPSAERGDTMHGRVRRIILGKQERGRIVCLRVVQEIDSLIILRERG